MHACSQKVSLQMIMLSVSATTLFLLSRVPRNNVMMFNRVMRLGVYSSIVYSNVYANKLLNHQLEEKTFENVALHLLPDQEVKRMFRNYNVRT